MTNEELKSLQVLSPTELLLKYVKLAERIESAEAALIEYVEMETLVAPENWDYSGMGRGPEMEELEKDDIGEAARAHFSRYGDIKSPRGSE